MQQTVVAASSRVDDRAASSRVDDRAAAAATRNSIIPSLPTTINSTAVNGSTTVDGHTVQTPYTFFPERILPYPGFISILIGVACILVFIVFLLKYVKEMLTRQYNSTLPNTSRWPPENNTPPGRQDQRTPSEDSAAARPPPSYSQTMMQDTTQEDDSGSYGEPEYIQYLVANVPNRYDRISF